MAVLAHARTFLSVYMEAIDTPVALTSYPCVLVLQSHREIISITLRTKFPRPGCLNFATKEGIAVMQCLPT